MLIQGRDMDITEAIQVENLDATMLKKTKNGLWLSEKHKKILSSHGIPYEKYKNLSSLIFDLESARQLGDDFDDELESLADFLSEFYYYHYTKK